MSFHTPPIFPVIITIISIITMFPQSSGAQEDLSQNLTFFLERTIEQNPEIKQQEALYYSIVENLSQAKAGYRPSLSLDGDTTHTDTSSKGNTFFTEDGSNHSSQVGLNLSQPLFRGGSTIANIKQAKNTATAQYWQLNQTYQDLLLETITAYWDVLVQQSLTNLNQKNQTLLENRLKETVARFEAGELTKTDVSQAKARLANSEAELATATGNLENAKANLSRLVDLPVNTIEEDSLRPDLPESLDQAINDALEYNPVIRQAQKTKEASDKTIDSIKGEFLPQVSLNASTTRSYDPPPGFLTEQDTNNITVTASIPLYTGGATRSRLRQARYQDMANEFSVKDQEHLIRQNVITAWNNYQTSEYNVRARKQQVEAISIANEGIKREHEYGVRTLIELLDSDQEYLNAQVDLAIAKRDKIIAGFSLARQVGALSPETFNLSKKLPNNSEIMKDIGGNWFGFGVDYPE